jgi:hypothetical protein
MNTQLIHRGSTTELVLAGNKLTLSDRTAKLLFVSHEDPPPQRTGFGISISISFYDGELHIDNLSPQEPSTIYTQMPIRKPGNPGLVPRPDYGPSYAALSPEQKWTYLHWLTNVTQPVNIGFVFVYYYGLERHLLLGDFDAAFDEIILLRQTHSENVSFESYSRAALLNSAVIKKRPDRLEQLYRLFTPTRFSNTDLLLAHQLGYDLGVDGLMRLAPTLRNVQKRYLKSHADQYRAALDTILTEQFGEPYLPFGSAYSISDVPKRLDVLFANYSFPKEVRTPLLPNFLHHAPFVAEAERILNLAHDRTKQLLAERRKSHKPVTRRSRAGS